MHSLDDAALRSLQCDQMASLLVQYLAICNTEHLPKTIQLSLK